MNEAPSVEDVFLSFFLSFLFFFCDGTGDEVSNRCRVVKSTGETLNQTGDWRAVGGGTLV